jgi:adenine-specific DNA-methyltransferase
MTPLTAQDPETKSLDLMNENITKLRALFPELLTEGQDGVAVNLDVLKQLVGDKTVTDADEKYGLNWHGKRRASQLSLTPSTGTLRPCPEDSVDWDTTQNLMIEGDNLEVLKLLQKSYAGKVKLIYIDPPYNTGKDFVYPDNFQDNIKNYLELTGQTGAGGKKLSSNTEASGRFHTDWLNMMYPRLKLARNLLREDGAIMISIDENEVTNLLALCNEVFGEENLVECLVYDKKAAPKGVPPVNMIVGVHEYILCYSKTESFKFIGTLRSKDDFSNPDNDPRGIWRNTNLRSTTKDASQAFDIADPLTGRTYKDTWAFSQSEMQRMIAESRLIFPASNDGQVRQKEFFSEFDTPYIPVKSSLGLFDAQKNTEVLTRLMGEKIFQNPKHIDLMRLLISIAVAKDDLILDFFAGSGSTAHGIFMQNAMDIGNRRHILVQLPEFLDLKNKDQASAADFCDKVGKPSNIAELTKERLRRAGKKIREENPLFAGDLGFRVFKLGSTNIREWDPNRENLAEPRSVSRAP